MHPMGNARDHFWLTIGMSKAVGADLGEALKTGRLSHEDYAEMVTACRTCEHPDRCQHLLSETPSLDEAPDYCVNRKIWQALLPEGAA